MIELIRRSGISIPRKYDQYDFYQMIIKHLRRRQQNYNSPDFIVNEFFSESDKTLLIPRFFPLEKYIECKFIDHQHDGEDIDITHNIIPRNKTQEKSIEFMLNNDYGILQLSPGMGKTIISIAVIAERKKKSFILVHRSALDKQWRERLVSFTNLKEDDIALLETAKLEEQLKKPIIVATTQTFVSILKRRLMDFLIALNEANIGVFIADEVHTTVGAPTFSNCSIHIPSKCTFGLSATPYRWDGNSDIIQYHLGDIFKIEDDTDTMPAEVTIMLSDYNIDTPNRHQWLHWEGNFQRARYLNIMRNSPVFMKLCKAMINRLKVDRNLLVICERVEKLINPLFDWVKHDNKSKFIAGSSLKELEYSLTFSTPGKIRDGIDAPWKDSLLITSPVRNIEQLSGRIVRTAPGKKTPIIIDMVDFGCPHMSGQTYSRVDYYHSKGWPVRFIYVNPITFEKSEKEESEAMQIIRGE
jgi:hypothetical protein